MYAQEFDLEAIDTVEDKFCFKIEVKDKPQTRRGLLSVVCSVYHPLRFATPVILPAMLMLQDLCQKKNRGSDDPDFHWSHEWTSPVQLETTGQKTKDDPEVKSEVQTLLTAADNGINRVNQLLEHFSSWLQLKKIIARILRYREMLRAACTTHNKGSEQNPHTYKQVEPN